MVRNYKKRSSRGQWDNLKMKEAISAVRGGMSCLAAATMYKIPEATLRRRLKKTDDVRLIFSI